MSCGEPQWWYDLINQEIVDQAVLGNFLDVPLFTKSELLSSIGIDDIQETCEFGGMKLEDYPAGQTLSPVDNHEEAKMIAESRIVHADAYLEGCNTVSFTVSGITVEDRVTVHRVDDADAAYERAMKGI